jgi:hypothetical protein
MGYKSNGVETYGLPINLVKAIIKGFDVKHFVETGTYMGESVLAASKIFQNCHTIEVIAGRTPKRDYPSNINFYVGDSPTLLREIMLKTNMEYTVYWLDAHYCDSEPPPPDCVECPIIDEITAIYAHQNAIILIDDARMFFGAPPAPATPSKWATILDIFETLSHCFPNHHITIVDDFVICIPDEMKANLNEEWRSRFHIRYPNVW